MATGVTAARAVCTASAAVVTKRGSGAVQAPSGRGSVWERNVSRMVDVRSACAQRPNVMTPGRRCSMPTARHCGLVGVVVGVVVGVAVGVHSSMVQVQRSAAWRKRRESGVKAETWIWRRASCRSVACRRDVRVGDGVFCRLGCAGMGDGQAAGHCSVVSERLAVVGAARRSVGAGSEVWRKRFGRGRRTCDGMVWQVVSKLA